jgi:diaminopimelate decarboxylase
MSDAKLQQPLPGKVSAASPAAIPASEARALLGAYGSPLFVLSEGVLRAGYRAFRDAFAEAGVPLHIAYSYKTNYLPAVCAILHEEGAWAEVVSGAEYALARALGRPAHEIVFNGPGKGRAELAAALGDGAVVNIDGFDELAAVAQVAEGLGAGPQRPARVGIRVGLAAPTGAWTRFGFGLESGDAFKALARIAAEPALKLEMLHHHGGTDQPDLAPYSRAAEALCGLTAQARGLRLEPEMIDLGGGFPSDRPHGPYAAAIRDGLSAAMGPAQPPLLVLEPGRALVDPAMQLLCTVVATKEISSLGPAVVADAGLNLLPPACRRAPRPIRALTGDGAGAAAGGETRSVTVFGPLCMPEDMLAKAVPLPPLRPGAILSVAEAGAYTLTQSMQFIQPRPAVVLLGRDGPEAIRRPETWRDLVALDRLPERLRPAGADL